MPGALGQDSIVVFGMDFCLNSAFVLVKTTVHKKTAGPKTTVEQQRRSAPSNIQNASVYFLIALLLFNVETRPGRISILGARNAICRETVLWRVSEMNIPGSLYFAKNRLTRKEHTGEGRDVK